MSEYNPTPQQGLHDLAMYLDGEATDEEFDSWCGKGNDEATDDVISTWKTICKESSLLLAGAPAENPDCSYCWRCANTLFRVHLNGDALVKVVCARCGEEYRAPTVVIQGGTMSRLEK